MTLFKTVKTCNQERFSLGGEHINKYSGIHIVEYYKAQKRNALSHHENTKRKHEISMADEPESQT